MQGDRYCGFCHLLPEPYDYTGADQHDGGSAGRVCVLTSQANDEACCYIVVLHSFDVLHMPLSGLGYGEVVNCAQQRG